MINRALKNQILKQMSLVALLAVWGSPAHATVTATPVDVNFGKSIVGTAAAPVQVVLNNNNRTSVKIENVSTSISQFSYLGPSLPLSLAPGRSLTILVTFKPSATESSRGQLVFARTNGSPIRVLLTGTGISSPSVSGKSGVVGGSPSSTSSGSTTSTNSLPATSSSTTTTSASSSSSGTSSTSTPGGNSSGSSSSGTPPLQGQLSASPAAINFGSVTVGNSNTQTISISNSGKASFVISNVILAGPGLSATGASSGGLSVAPGATVALNVMFDPATSGAMSGSVTIVSTAADSTSSITLSGNGVQPVSHSVSLSWDGSVSSGVDGYNVYRATGSSGSFAMLTSSPTTSSTYSDTTVQSGQTYSYEVTSVTSGGVQSTFSNVATATIP